MVRFLPDGEKEFRTPLDDLLVGEPEDLLHPFLRIFPYQFLDEVRPKLGIVLDRIEAQGGICSHTAKECRPGILGIE